MQPQAQSEEAIAAGWAFAHGRYDPLEALALHVRVRRALERVLRWLGARGIGALPVKGVVLAHTLYARPTDRPIRDIDLKVRARDLDAVARFFADEPGGLLVRWSRLAGSVMGQIDHIEVDVEAGLGPPLLSTLGADALFARAERTSAGLGFEYSRIDASDHALLLAIDRFKDHVGAKPWASWDLARIVREPDFEVERFAARAREAGCATIAHVVARTMAESEGDRAWAEIAARVAPVRAGYAEHMVARLRAGKAAGMIGRVAARAASDSRIRAAASVVASAAWAVGGYGSVVRSTA